ncbi:GPI-GlcNAc transferase complex [Colletotrichum graminicola]|uniref:GPI-GlcNAc transferase complex n=1 Tax=Colletotrichum graminicola (strain M1.001 / M2 / FGSC 10212) TaxID=645133 RepID=E3QGP2_COLGM|nr:GPI-GlcNAc transferase complex [Colletotrichum graminicola M1.001]EFQ30030.1 GPI-GlcNAc transferase complex [Colletotrichum graminicola M1.001]WDK09809.1 GPI-GlcNAc transferase complex [Colletotrichum graminicola]
MLTTAPRLHVRRPSPTTAEFTVTTRPPQTLTIRLLSSLLLVLRIVVFLSTILLLHAAWSQSPYAAPYFSQSPARTPDEAFFSPSAFRRALHFIHASAPGHLAHRVAASPAVPLPALVPGCLLAAYATLRREHTTESLLVLRGLGIQTSSTSGSYLSAAATRFIPTEKIQDVLVNEAFRGFEVRYYLIVVVEGEEDLVVVFPRLLPRKKIVETVWRGVRGCLWEADGTVSGSSNTRKMDERWQGGV